MTDKKTGDPKDDDRPAGRRRFVPVTGTYGTEVVVPGPLTAGPPRPEPEERWTLAPVRDASLARASDDPGPSEDTASEEDAPHVHGPVLSPSGTILVVPEPLTSGPPQPEPEERWTLAPGHVPERPAGEDDDAPEKGAPVEPVRAKVTRPAPEDSEPDRS
jgi:hypothetical protein